MEMKIRLPRYLRDAPVASAKEQKLARQVADELALNSNSAYRLHVYHVFNDPDFGSAVRKLRNYLETKYYEDISLNAQAQHLIIEDKELVADLANKFCITLDDLRLYADGWYAVGAPYGNELQDSGIVQNGNGLYYKIGAKTTLKDITKEWDYIKLLRKDYYGKQNTKNKAPENHELIYAVFKARNRSKPYRFSEIYSQYSTNQLKGYSVKVSPDRLQYDEESLERYFRKYMPSVKTDT